MGRKPISDKPMTPAERQQRRREVVKRQTVLTDGQMTKSERTDLGALIRRRERLMKTKTKQRALELMADFEKQLDTRYSYDDDDTWKAAYAAAEKAAKDAKAVIAQQCGELGIPPEFAPDLSLSWYDCGRNALKSERAELRRVATTRIAAMEAEAKTAIEHLSIEAQTALITEGFTTAAAQTFLEKMPSADVLMPLLVIAQVRALSDTSDS